MALIRRAPATLSCTPARCASVLATLVYSLDLDQSELSRCISQNPRCVCMYVCMYVCNSMSTSDCLFYLLIYLFIYSLLYEFHNSLLTHITPPLPPLPHSIQ